MKIYEGSEGMSIGEALAIFGFLTGVMGFLFKNYHSFQDNTNAISSLNKAIDGLHHLIQKISDKQGMDEDRIIKLEEQTKSLWKNQREASERVRELERKK